MHIIAQQHQCNVDIFCFDCVQTLPVNIREFLFKIPTLPHLNLMPATSLFIIRRAHNPAKSFSLLCQNKVFLTLQACRTNFLDPTDAEVLFNSQNLPEWFELWNCQMELSLYWLPALQPCLSCLRAKTISGILVLPWFYKLPVDASYAEQSLQERFEMIPKTKTQQTSVLESYLSSERWGFTRKREQKCWQGMIEKGRCCIVCLSHSASLFCWS